MQSIESKVQKKKKVVHLTNKELALVLKNILTFKKPERIAVEKDTIDALVQEQDVMESKIRVIEQSALWKEHAQAHQGAHLQPIGFQDQEPTNIRESLNVDKMEYAVAQSTPSTGYGVSASPVQGQGAGQQQEYLTFGSEPNSIFWMGCTCGMTIKSEEGKSGMEVKGYAGSDVVTPSVSYDVGSSSTQGSYSSVIDPTFSYS
jgi:hypothetical protein